MDSSPLFFATSGPTKRRKYYFCLLFSQYWTGVEKNQCSRHFSEKSNPGLFYLEPHRKVNATTLDFFAANFKNLKKKQTNPFSNLDFWQKSGFPMPGFVPVRPPGGFIFPEMTPKKQKRNSDNWPGSPGRNIMF